MTDAVLTREDAARRIREVEEAVAGVVVGQPEVVRQVLACVLARGHALLEGSPGLGKTLLVKTLLVKTLSAVLGVSFSRIQFTPDLLPADVTGFEELSLKDGVDLLLNVAA